VKEYLNVGPEVETALRDGRPVVALESTVIAHGLPRPHNVRAALELERIVREEGAVPATVAVLEGRLCVGLAEEQIRRLGEEPGFLKLSRRDLGYALARRRDGATTVSATMIAARLAGIEVFATGGIGGVHRGVEESLDVSADLRELSRTPVVVVSAGAKAILDLPRTMELLETEGVPVVGYGTDELPAFYSRSSGLKVGLRADSPAEVARI
jgi:pseudouridine-5'-phosphate glycosidase